MSKLEQLPILVSQFERAQEINEYENLTNEFNTLRLKVESKQEITEKEDKEFFIIIQRQWKRVIVDKYTELKDKIKKRKTRGESFFDIFHILEKIRSDGEKDLDIDEYYTLFFGGLVSTEKKVDEKISNEKYQIKMLIIGLVLGIGLTKLFG